MNDITRTGEVAKSQGDQLAEDNRELRARLQYLANRQTALEQRLERVEGSVIFRFLKWLGSKVGWLGASVGGNSPFPDIAGENRDYSRWLKQTVSLQDRPVSSPPVGSGRHSRQRDHLSVVLNATGSERSQIEGALASLNLQHRKHSEIFVCADTEIADWLEATIRQNRNLHTFEIFRGSTEQERFERALHRCTGEFTAIVAGNAVLEQATLDEWLAAADSDSIAVYSDWDFISIEGNRHTPRFTPECSPELLSQTLYWGVSFLARTAVVRELSLTADSTFQPVHQVALALANSGGEIRRIPRVLWHLQDRNQNSVSRPELYTSPARGRRYGSPVPENNADAGASIIVCSRNAKLLNNCLTSLKPTLREQDEVIVVAHLTGDRHALESTARKRGARFIPYEGEFHFGEMNRLGIAASTAQLICLLNDDVTPIAPDWLPRMLAQATRANVGVVGALLLYPNGTIEHAGIAVGGRHSPGHMGRFQRGSLYWPWLRMTREVTAVTGACMAFRRAVWDELNGFDRRFPENYNDVDLCLRASEQGYKVLLEARAILTHEGCRTRVARVRNEEHELFYKLWWPLISTSDRFYNPQLGNVIEPIVLGTANRLQIALDHLDESA